MILLFDAANTLIYKPKVYTKIISVLDSFNYDVKIEKLSLHHKLISEFLIFPDRTSRKFYDKFNSELLYSLGIIPNEKILENLFNECSYLPWEKFEDTKFLNEIEYPKFILSNFNNSLEKIIENLFPNIFEGIICSETEKIRKPDVNFYSRALEILNVKNPKSILYIGDSLQLDMHPASEIGMNVCLIDRYNYYPNYQHRIADLSEIKKKIDVIENDTI